MLQDRSTYEIMRPDDVGYVGTNLVLGKHSGRHAFRTRVVELGYNLEDVALQKVFDDFIALADKKKDVYDADIVALIDSRVDADAEAWHLLRFHIAAGTGTIPTATVELRNERAEVVCDAAIGDGPVDAVCKALERIVGIAATLEDYQVRSVSEGQDAQGEVLLEIQCQGRRYHGKAVSTDIVEASAQAYLKALNKALLKSRETPAS